MRLPFRSARRVSIVGAVYLMSLALTEPPYARAEDGDWVTTVSPAFEDYVFTASHPPEWKIGGRYPSHKGFLLSDLSTTDSSLDALGVTASAYVNTRWEKQEKLFWHPFPSAVQQQKVEIPSEIMAALTAGTATGEQLAQIIPKTGCGDGRKCVEFERTPFRVSHHAGLLIERAPSEVFDSKLNSMVTPKGSDGFGLFFAPNEELMGLRIEVDIRLHCPDITRNCPDLGDLTSLYPVNNTLLASIYQELRPDFMKFLESAKFQHISEVSKNAEFEIIHVGSIRTTTAPRKEFWANLSFELTHPSDWDVRTIEATPADSERSTGRLIEAATAPNDAASVGEPEDLFIVVSGLELDGSYDFLATTEPLVGQFMPEFERISSESVEAGGMSYLAKNNQHRPYFTHETGQTYVNTYIGKGESGEDLKIRTYTAGSQTTVMNFIFVADAADFDRVLPAVEKMVDSVSINLTNPVPDL